MEEVSPAASSSALPQEQSLHARGLVLQPPSTTGAGGSWSRSSSSSTRSSSSAKGITTRVLELDAAWEGSLAAAPSSQAGFDADTTTLPPLSAAATIDTNPPSRSAVCTAWDSDAGADSCNEPPGPRTASQLAHGSFDEELPAGSVASRRVTSAIVLVSRVGLSTEQKRKPK